MGAFLRDTMGRGHLAIGFTFGQSSFLSEVEALGGEWKKYTVGAAGPGRNEHTLDQAGTGVRSFRTPAPDDRIARLRRISQADDRLEGVLLHGSWTLGEVDAHSDIEAYFHVHDDRLPGFEGPAFGPSLTAPGARAPGASAA
ncbi:erythromycin esterase family protein [Streptomyces sp. NPDC047987]|uniref:erythromycin esterase family protein n=1 Tax=unclassified Streptomyces TaxID=2593676 RepID=UPI003437BA89